MLTLGKVMNKSCQRIGPLLSKGSVLDFLTLMQRIGGLSTAMSCTCTFMQVHRWIIFVITWHCLSPAHRNAKQHAAHIILVSYSSFIVDHASFNLVRIGVDMGRRSFLFVPFFASTLLIFSSPDLSEAMLCLKMDLPDLPIFASLRDKLYLLLHS